MRSDEVKIPLKPIQIEIFVRLILIHCESELNNAKSGI